MSGLTLVQIPPDMAREVWPYAEDLVEQAIDRCGLSSRAVVRDRVMDGRALLWLVTDGAYLRAVVVTTLAVTESRTVCEIVACAGERMSEWLHLLEGIEKYARTMNCKSVRVMGRKGWARALKDYSSKHVILEKDLT
jgi:hypothetical protein